MIDGMRLKSICAGAPELAIELVEALIEDVRPLVAAASDLAESRSEHGLRETAHAIKGIAGNIGAQQLQGVAATLEAAAALEASHNWIVIAATLGDVELALEAVEKLHARWLAAPASSEGVFAAGAGERP